MNEKEIMTVKQVAEYLEMDEHTSYLPREIEGRKFEELFPKRDFISRGELARTGQIPSLKIAGQWRFKKDVIDKWISEESLERVLQNMKSSATKKGKVNK